MDTLLYLLAGNTLTRVVFFPTLACLPLLLFRRDAGRPVKLYGLAVALVELVFAVALVVPRLGAGEGFAALREVGPDGRVIDWIPRFGIRYELAMDGVSMPLMLLTALLLPVVVAGSWRGIERHWKGYLLSLLLLTTGILGALVAFDLFLFTMVGSLLMLLGIVWLAWTHQQLGGGWSFAYDRLLALELPWGEQLWLFAAFALAFAIKVPLFPLHTWLPDAHVEAPTGGSVLLAGILLKLGTYGFVRFALPLFPHAAEAAQPLLVALALVGIVYGGLVAWAQEDFKKLVAYSSVAHLGFVVLGLFAFDLVAWQGSLVQMINHGLSTGALFLLVGMLYERRHTKAFEEFGGLARVMPWFAFFLVFVALASVGLPGLNGFVGEFLILAGSFRAGLVWPTVIATFGVVVAALYVLKMVARTLWGPLRHEANRGLSDLSLREILVLAPLALLMLIIGLAPEPFLAPSRPDLDRVLAHHQARVAVPPPPRPLLGEQITAATHAGNRAGHALWAGPGPATERPAGPPGAETPEAAP